MHLHMYVVVKICDVTDLQGVGASGDSYAQGCPCKEDWKEQIESCREAGIVIHAVECTGTKDQDVEKFT